MGRGQHAVMTRVARLALYLCLVAGIGVAGAARVAWVAFRETRYTCRDFRSDTRPPVKSRTSTP